MSRRSQRRLVGPRDDRARTAARSTSGSTGRPRHRAGSRAQARGRSGRGQRRAPTPSGATAASSRSVISTAARLLNVIARIASGGVPVAISQAARATSVVVLPGTGRRDAQRSGRAVRWPRPAGPAPGDRVARRPDGRPRSSDGATPVVAASVDDRHWCRAHAQALRGAPGHRSVNGSPPRRNRRRPSDVRCCPVQSTTVVDGGRSPSPADGADRGRPSSDPSSGGDQCARCRPTIRPLMSAVTSRLLAGRSRHRSSPPAAPRPGTRAPASQPRVSGRSVLRRRRPAPGPRRQVRRQGACPPSANCEEGASAAAGDC